MVIYWGWKKKTKDGSRAKPSSSGANKGCGCISAAWRTKAKLRTATENHMNMLVASPESVMAYFQDPRVKYAA